MQKGFQNIFTLLVIQTIDFISRMRIFYILTKEAQGDGQVMFEELNLPISSEEIKKGFSQLRNGPDLF